MSMPKFRESQFEHGVRARYVAGCRCAPCRKANTLYQRTRARAKVYGHANPLVDATPSRQHAVRLGKAGMGWRTIAEVAGVPKSTLQRVLDRERRYLRKSTADRILAVTPAPKGGARVPARATWKKVNALLAEGFSKAELARRLGYKQPALQLGKRWVTAGNAKAVAAFYAEIMAGGEEPRRRRQGARCATGEAADGGSSSVGSSDAR